MQPLGFYTKLFLSVFVFCFIIWFGGNIVRSAIAFDLFEPARDMIIKNDYNDEVRFHHTYIYSLTSIYTTVSYILAFLSSLFLLVKFRPFMKSKGWIFMAFVLFYIAAPVELFLLWNEIKLSLSVFYDPQVHFYSYDVQNYFVERYQSVALTTASGLAFLSAATAVLYVIWRPLESDELQDLNPEIKE